ncbi:MAG: hypothetical protein MRQ07_05370 [Candidatus Midichloria sp.]|nr:hypothetical protein [Candidatus Midichloria sp.]
MSANQITILPHNIRKLDNNLITLPNTLGNMKDLTDIDLRSNAVECLPSFIGELKNLRLFIRI